VLSEDLSHCLVPGTGETGWLARTGPVPLGYYKDAEKTARTFPEVDGVRYSVPGDRAEIEADGTLRLLGRDSATINSGGEKIFAEEVEHALKHHPAVHIARYKLPRAFVFVDEILRSPSGKADYRWAKATAGAALGIEV
jgi:fatty-acyl-CoA synthase